MIDLTRTTTALLEGLGRSVDDGTAWATLDARYQPLLINLGRRYGLTNAEAADAAQDTMLDFLKAYREGRYDPGKGRLRSWMIGIHRRRMIDIVRDRSKRNVVGGATIADQEPGDAELEHAWDEERAQIVLEDAMRALREESGTADRTIRAFELVGLRGLTASAAAEQLGMSVSDVYVAKSRCLKRLRVLVEEREHAFEGD
ncbi:MAG: sigma-70 family RNA polymerase sigma factor [Planctomycetota bacterium]